VASRKDWLPGAKAARLEMARNWGAILTERATGWGIPGAEVTALGGLTDAAGAALVATKGPGRGPVATEVCKDAFIALAAKMRFIKGRFFFVPPLTNEDLVALGLRPKDTKPSRIGPAEGSPGVQMTARGDFQVVVRVWDERTGERRRPYGMVGAAARYVVADAPVTDMALFTRSDLITRSPWTFVGAGAERGKWISMAMCWQSESGVKGPWSAPKSTVSP
jgi:hypothetical protein